jgi:hypothetical protein
MAGALFFGFELPDARRRGNDTPDVTGHWAYAPDVTRWSGPSTRSARNVQGSLFRESDALALFAVRYLWMNGRSVRTVTQLVAPTIVSAHDVTEKAGSMTNSAQSCEGRKLQAE